MPTVASTQPFAAVLESVPEPELEPKPELEPELEPKPELEPELGLALIQLGPQPARRNRKLDRH